MDSDFNPFMSPATRSDPALEGDHAARAALLPAESRLMAVGGLWMFGGLVDVLMYGAVTLFTLVGIVMASTAEAKVESLLVGVVYGVIAGVRCAFFAAGRRIWRLEPLAYDRLRAWSLLGIFCGPCSAVNLVLPFLVLREDARSVLTEEHRALRERTPDLAPSGVVAWTAGIVGGLLAALFASLAIIVLLTALGGALGQKFTEVAEEVEAVP